MTLLWLEPTNTLIYSIDEEQFRVPTTEFQWYIYQSLAHERIEIDRLRTIQRVKAQNKLSSLVIMGSSRYAMNCLFIHLLFLVASARMIHGEGRRFDFHVSSSSLLFRQRICRCVYINNSIKNVDAYECMYLCSYIHMYACVCVCVCIYLCMYGKLVYV